MLAVVSRVPFLKESVMCTWDLEVTEVRNKSECEEKKDGSGEVGAKTPVGGHLGGGSADAAIGAVQPLVAAACNSQEKQVQQ